MSFSAVKIVASAAALVATLLSPASADCVPQDSPNTIYPDYPNIVSGNLNTTIMIVPISMETAREVIPNGWGILEDAFRSLLPSFPEEMYPMMVVGAHDHDLHLPAYNFSLPDFTRTSLEFPFVDLLGDGYSTFRWAGTMMITDGSLAIGGSEGYGIKVYPAAFDPECDAYKATSDCGGASFKATSTGSTPRSMHIETQPSHGELPITLDFIRNITNQVVFANASICDNYQRLFNTSLSLSPVAVKGTVTAQLEPFAEEKQTWRDVFGWRVASVFLEPPVGAPCQDFQGYRGTGPGDSTEL